MGEHDAGRCRGVDRPTAAEMTEFQTIPESVSPEGLLARAEYLRSVDPSCARHLELAAEEIRKLRRQLPKKPVEDAELGTRYVTATNEKLKAVSFTIYRRDDLLGYMIFDPEQTYDVGSHLIHLYDKLEGLV